MVKFGVIGSGWIAEEFVKGAILVDGMTFSAIYSRTHEKGEEFSAKFGGAEVYTDIVKFAESDIDAVYIASPNCLHYEQSKLMLEHGKHVLCEKPIVTQPEQFDELLNLAKSRSLIYTEAIMMLHQPARKIIKEALKEIGNITTAHFDFSQLSSKYEALKKGENPNIFNPKMLTGCLRDLGIYCYYPAIDFFGMPKKIFSSAGFVETGADGYGTAVLDYDGMQITLTYSKIGQDYTGSQIIGDKGTITIESISKLTGVKAHYSDGSGKILVEEAEKHILMGREAQDFYNYITEPDKFKNEYDECNKIISEVCSVMYRVKTECGIL